MKIIKSPEHATQMSFQADGGSRRKIRDGARRTAHLVAYLTLPCAPLTVGLAAIFGSLIIYARENKDIWRDCPPKLPFPTHSLLALLAVATITLIAHLPFIHQTLAPLFRQSEREFRFACSGGTIIIIGGIALNLHMISGRQALINNVCLHDHQSNNLLLASALLFIIGIALSLLSPLASPSTMEDLLPGILRNKAERLANIDPLLAAPTSLEMRRWSANEVRTIKVLAASVDNDSLVALKAALRYALPAISAITLGLWSHEGSLELLAEHQSRIVEWSLQDTLWAKAFLSLGTFGSVITFLILDLRAKIRQWLRTVGQILELSPSQTASRTLGARRAPTRVSRRLRSNDRICRQCASRRSHDTRR